MRADVIHPRWYPLLDFENQRLNLPNTDLSLSRRDMALWRLMLLGYSQKIIADTLHLSVSAINKRIALSREKYKAAQKDFIAMPQKLEAGMATYGLTTFLVGHPDWFASESCHQTENQLPVAIGGL
jgi:DNA-binding CsgD family transcriptional regulator